MMPLKDMMNHVFEYDITCFSCSKPLVKKELERYPHENGWETENGKEWLYFRCTHCHYDTSMSKVLRQMEYLKNPKIKRYPVEDIGLNMEDLQLRANNIIMNGKPYHHNPSKSYWLLFHRSQLYTKVELREIILLCYLTGDAVTDKMIKEYNRLYNLTQRMV